MSIWQLCANLLIPNCLRSNLSYSPLAALELYVNMVNEEWKFRYFILSRSQFIELLHSAHVWYKYDWYREKEISEKSPAGIDVKWLMGEDEPETKRHKAFVNPLKGVSCEDCWENIWKD